jgi:putative ABC transport system ATP-binding protein
MIGGLDRPTKGTIKLAGRDTSLLTESQFAALRHDTIGFIFQSYNLIPFLSAVENVELPLMFEPYDRKSLRKRAMELLELVGLGHRVHHQPTKMSGGEQQRTAIARSLISNPTLSSPTSRPPISTTARGRRWCACCATCVPRLASPLSPAPMTPRWPMKRPVSSG